MRAPGRQQITRSPYSIEQIAGISAAQLARSARISLYEYADATGLRFSNDALGLQSAVFGNPAAHSNVTEVRKAKDGELVASLQTFLLASGDGTGKESERYKAADYSFPYLPHSGRVVPQAQDGVAEAIALPLYPRGRELKQVTNLELIGLSPAGRNIVSVGKLGPFATRIVGTRLNSDGDEERFGDPYAIYHHPLGTTSKTVYVTGVLTVQAAALEAYPELLAGLNAQAPLSPDPLPPYIKDQY